MANTVRLKRSAVQGKAPVVGDLSLGELAVNTYDGKLYMKKNDGSDAIVEIGAGGTTVSATAPSSPSTGDLWYDTEDARTFVWTGTEWVDAAPDAGYAVATTSDSAPANANDGDLWYRTSDGRMYVYYDDGSTSQWVDANPNLPVGSDTFERSGTTVSLVNSGDTVSLDGDLAVDTSTLYVDSTNNRVGIGTSSPAVELDVNGEVRASTGILFGTDTAAANTLDDYEEGTWTPTYVGATTAGSYTSTNDAWYTKVGNLVTVYAELQNITDVSLGSGQLNIGGLPYVNGSSQALGSVIFSSFNLDDATVNLTALVDSGDSIFKIFETRDNANTSGVDVTDRSLDSSDVYLQVTYKVD